MNAAVVMVAVVCIGGVHALRHEKEGLKLHITGQHNCFVAQCVAQLVLLQEVSSTQTSMQRSLPVPYLDRDLV